MSLQPQAACAPAGRAALAEHYARVRSHSLALAAPLSAEDQCVQPMPDASPTKWHLAHTSWFFEAVVLAVHAPGYRPFDARWAHLFNSYYEALGSSAACSRARRWPKSMRIARTWTKPCRT